MGFAFNSYQNEAVSTASYPDLGENLLYPALGLAGESGETVDKIKKLWRNKLKTKGSQLTREEKDSLVAEIGDVLWYCAALAFELGVPLEDIASANINKLASRAARGVIKSEGDSR